MFFSTLIILVNISAIRNQLFHTFEFMMVFSRGSRHRWRTTAVYASFVCDDTALTFRQGWNWTGCACWRYLNISHLIWCSVGWRFPTFQSTVDETLHVNICACAVGFRFTIPWPFTVEIEHYFHFFLILCVNTRIVRHTKLQVAYLKTSANTRSNVHHITSADERIQLIKRRYHCNGSLTNNKLPVMQSHPVIVYYASSDALSRALLFSAVYI